MLAIGFFFLTLMIVNALETRWGFSAPSIVKKILISLIGAAGFIGIFNPKALRKYVMTRGRITRLGRWLASAFNMSEEQLSQAFTVSWVITFVTGIAIVVANILVNL